MPGSVCGSFFEVLLRMKLWLARFGHHSIFDIFVESCNTYVRFDTSSLVLPFLFILGYKVECGRAGLERQASFNGVLDLTSEFIGCG